jgi:hypothetical protein
MWKLESITIQKDRRIELPPNLRKDWLTEDDKWCAVELLQPWCVRLFPAGDLREDLRDLLAKQKYCGEDQSDPTAVPRFHFVPVKNLKGDQGQRRRLTLPHAACWTLLGGKGPVAPKGKKESISVLVHNREDSMILWGNPEKTEIAED